MAAAVLAAWVALALLLPSAATRAPPADPALPAGEVPDEIVVAFHNGVPDDLGAWAAARGGSVLLRDDVLHWASLAFASRADADAALLAARARADVRSAEHDGYVQALAAPNDPLYRFQWGLGAVLAPAAWELSVGSHAVRVAVVDTGIWLGHPDLAGNLCGPFASFVPTEPTIADGHGHGTHVAGIVAAVSGNGAGVAGASQSCVLGAKALDSSGVGQWSWVAAAVRWAADADADIISLSLGGLLPSTIAGDAVHHAYAQRGALVVAAAGNGGCATPQTVLFPAMFTQVMAVGALDRPGLTPASFSSCGAKVELSAPGVDILSTAPACTAWNVICSGTTYAPASGTSMAAPLVSGVAALVLAQHPGLPNHELRCLLDLTADDVGLAGRDPGTGWGRVDALAVLRYDRNLTAEGLHPTMETACLAAQVALGWAGGVLGLPDPLRRMAASA